MPVQLPDVPRLAQVTFRLISFRADLTPGLGGPVQRVNRLGTRFAIDVSVPALTGACAKAWIAARLKAEAENDTLRLNVPEADPEAFTPAVQVDGAGQAGTALAVKALAAARVVPAGLWLSFEASGRKYLHQTTSQVVASGAGKAVLTIAPMLRAAPPADAALSIAPAVIEGLCDGTAIEWQQQLRRFSTLSFTLTEAR